jgi:hypothetical protein
MPAQGGEPGGDQVTHSQDPERSALELKKELTSVDKKQERTRERERESVCMCV